MLDPRGSYLRCLHPHILRIRHILDRETRQSGSVLNPATAERNICSGDGASSLERHYRDDFTGCQRELLTAAYKTYSTRYIW